MRGVKIYLPEPTESGYAEFRKLVDFMCRFRYNCLMIETGGAMEYKSHPEINEGWVEYCSFMNEYSGKPQTIQHRFDWNKNSIHSTNGGGRVVPQEKLASLLDYCRERGIEVIPELPSLSHCDFLLTRHPELSERVEDPYPDTVCPRHPDYYPLLFDLVDETLALFRPRRMNLGHDEYYSVALCPRCRGNDAAELFAADIRRCRDYLNERGVTMMIWGEKLLDAHFPDGYPIGGNALGVWHQPDNPLRTPPTKRAMELVPRDLEILHWYWSVDRHLDEQYTAHGFPMIFGNFHGMLIPEWERRRQAPNFLGTCCSNWGATDFISLQRNAVLYEIAYSAQLHWDPSLTADDDDRIRTRVLAELYEEKCRQDPPGRYVEVVHSTNEDRPYAAFFDGNFVDEHKDTLGYHIFRSDSGDECRFPVIWGSNITSRSVRMNRGRLETLDLGIGGDHKQDCYTFDRRFMEVSYSTLPEATPSGLVCRCRYPLPNDGREYFYKRFEPCETFSGEVRLEDFRVERKM